MKKINYCKNCGVSGKFALYCGCCLSKIEKKLLDDPFFSWGFLLIFSLIGVSIIFLLWLI